MCQTLFEEHFMHSFNPTDYCSPHFTDGPAELQRGNFPKGTQLVSGGVRNMFQHSGSKACTLNCSPILPCNCQALGQVLSIHIRNCTVMYGFGMPLFHPKKVKSDLLIIHFIVDKGFHIPDLTSSFQLSMRKVRQDYNKILALPGTAL